MAKIHTVEWTPAILPNHTPARRHDANWYGLVTSLFGGKRKQVLEEIPITNRELGGHRRQPAGRRFAEYGLGEEFTAVYRLHSLLPDAVRIVDLDGKPDRCRRPAGRTRHAGVARG